jgi:hypothetical protein
LHFVTFESPQRLISAPGQKRVKQNHLHLLETIEIDSVAISPLVAKQLIAYWILDKNMVTLSF